MISFGVPDAEVQYLSPHEAQGFRTEFFSFPRVSSAANGIQVRLRGWEWA